MIFKLLDEKDIPDMVALYRKDFPDGWSAEMLLSAFKREGFFAIGALVGEKLVGVITCDRGMDSADVEGVVTASEMRKRGVATALMERAERELKAFETKRILLEVREGNSNAIALYEKLGYKTVSVRKKYYQDGENALVMMKEL